jgi:hypothetical protein
MSVIVVGAIRRSGGDVKIKGEEAARWCCWWVGVDGCGCRSGVVVVGNIVVVIIVAGPSGCISEDGSIQGSGCDAKIRGAGASEWYCWWVGVVG